MALGSLTILGGIGPFGTKQMARNPLTTTRSRRAEMAPQYPITESLVEAFCTAILAFNDWKGGDPEPQVFLDGKFLPVSAVANYVSIFKDPMPDGINDFLCQVIGTGDAPTDTFAAGGNRLYHSCMELRTRRAKTRGD